MVMSKTATSTPAAAAIAAADSCTKIHEHFQCGICEGYIIDATTIVDCVHSFCKSCLIQYFDSCGKGGDYKCPTCDRTLHRDLEKSIKFDPTFQRLIYQSIPNLLKNELERRERYYLSLSSAEKKAYSDMGILHNASKINIRLYPDTGEDEDRQRNNRYRHRQQHRHKHRAKKFKATSEEEEEDTSKENCHQHHHHHHHRSVEEQQRRARERKQQQEALTRYLQCEAITPLRIIEKLLRGKYSVPPNYKIKFKHYEYELENKDETFIELFTSFIKNEFDIFDLKYEIRRIDNAYDVELSQPVVDTTIVKQESIEPSDDNSPCAKGTTAAPSTSSSSSEETPPLQPPSQPLPPTAKTTAASLAKVMNLSNAKITTTSTISSSGGGMASSPLSKFVTLTMPNKVAIASSTFPPKVLPRLAPKISPSPTPTTPPPPSTSSPPQSNDASMAKEELVSSTTNEKSDPKLNTFTTLSKPSAASLPPRFDMEECIVANSSSDDDDSSAAEDVSQQATDAAAAADNSAFVKRLIVGGASSKMLDGGLEATSSPSTTTKNSSNNDDTSPLDLSIHNNS